MANSGDTRLAARDRRIAATVVAAIILGSLGGSARGALTSLRVEDYATMPMTGSVAYPSASANSAYLARPNFMAEEPGGGNRFFVNDLNGPLYILDKTTKQFTTYLNFNGRGSSPGLFDKFVFASGFANGLITFQFDPDYANNGRFYTVHMEQPSTSGSLLPNNSSVPGFNTAGYSATTSVPTPTNFDEDDNLLPPARQTVLIEWSDSNIGNNTFEGTARELLRLDMQGQIHPMGDLIFNPTAKPGDADWRVMYVSIGDGGAGEQTTAHVRRTPQLLDTLGGKVLRIIPDLAMSDSTNMLSPNGRYLIPKDNPFADPAAYPSSRVRDEIWALGMRNPHRMSWDVDPGNANPATNNQLIANDIGLHTWEEVNFVKKGINYGYSMREGPQRLSSTNGISALPNPDTIPKDTTCTNDTFMTCSSNGTLTPTYPVIAYGHDFDDSAFIGDSISSGYVYRGSKIPALYGKYIFGEITTGQIFYADYAEMLLADDGNPATMATIHSLDIVWDDPNDSPNLGLQTYSTTSDVPTDTVHGPMFKIADKAYHHRGGLDPHLPGSAGVTGTDPADWQPSVPGVQPDPYGRADIRIQIDEAGELYIISKSDGMIRQIVGPPRIAGDYDHDGDVDGADYGVWKGAFGTTVPVVGLWADGNSDGKVDGADYVVWRNAFAGASSAITSVPEPASGIMLLLGSFLIGAVSARLR